MTLYIKKPVRVDAYQWFKIGDSAGNGVVDVMRWGSPEVDTLLCAFCNNLMSEHGYLHAFQVGHVVCPGDYIVTDIDGKQYVCKPNVFVQEYDLAV